jgi:ankyrin repeat protein
MKHSFFSRVCHFPITRLATVMLVVFAWSSLAFCGEIHDAAKAGDLAKIQALLKDNPDLVNSKETNGWTPLHWAAEQGYTNVAVLLLANKADVNAKAINGFTPLHIAAGGGYKDMVELLLASKADVNTTNKDGWMPLQLALLSRHKDVTELLCKAAPSTQLGDMKHDVTGVWKLSAEISAAGTVADLNGNSAGQMLLTQNPEFDYHLYLVQFKLKITGNGHVNGTIDGSKVTLTIPSDSFGDIVYEGDIVDDGTMKGTLRVSGGKTGTWHAKRDLGD